MISKRIYSVVAAAALLIASNGCTDAQTVRTYGYRIEETLPHDASSYTQGLFFHDGVLYESSGQYGESCFRQVDLKTGRVVKRENFERKYFVEGSCVLNGKLFILTWQEHECFVYDIKTWLKLGSFRYNGEGWGLTTDGKSLIMSDGTSKIRFLNPDTFMLEREITVSMNGKNVVRLNELEYIKGEIWANIYGSDMIARINPEDGKVASLVNCSNLLPRSLRKPSTDVLNGIAYDPSAGYIYLTGKYWPKMYRIEVVSK